MKVLAEDEYYVLVQTSQVPVLAAFGASWCVPCTQLTRTLESMEAEYKGQVSFVKLDVEECQNIANLLDVRSIPTLVLIKNSEPVAFQVGAQSKIKIDAMLRDYLE